jgi:hypothetical protein
MGQSDCSFVAVRLGRWRMVSMIAYFSLLVVLLELWLPMVLERQIQLESVLLVQLVSVPWTLS